MDRIEYFQNEKWGEDERPHVIQTIEEYNDLVAEIREDYDTWFGKFIELCKHYYAKEPCGGNLHIVLDDGNLADVHIAWCSGLAFGVRDMEGHDIAEIMRMMTRAQREKVYEHYVWYAYQNDPPTKEGQK